MMTTMTGTCCRIRLREGTWRGTCWMPRSLPSGCRGFGPWPLLTRRTTFSGADAPALRELLEGDRCVYFRCAPADQTDWYVHAAGAVVQTDSYWKHRFGNIDTRWAGTNEHSLTNWYAHSKIWEHFDESLEGHRKPRATDAVMG